MSRGNDCAITLHISLREIEIGTLWQFDGAIRELQEGASRSGSTLLYRGQTKRYFEAEGFADSLRPALCRGVRVLDVDDRQRYLEAFEQYLLSEVARDAALPEFWGVPVTVTQEGREIAIFNIEAVEKIPHTWVAVLQHYELATEMLDITRDPEVALAFGLWPFDFPPSAPQETGVVYVFELPEAETERRLHIDLQPLFTWDGNLRPVRQNGSLLSALYDDPDGQRESPNLYASYLAAILTLSSCDTLRERLLRRSPQLHEEYLFPSNQEDRLYRHLLDAQQSQEIKSVQISERKNNVQGLRLIETLPAVEPVTGLEGIDNHGQIPRSRSFEDPAGKALLIMNLYAGGTPQIVRAQRNVASIIDVVGREQPLKGVLCDNLDHGAPLGASNQFDNSAFAWSSFLGELPKDVSIRGVDDRRAAESHLEAFQATQGLRLRRAGLLRELESTMSFLRPQFYPADVLALDEVGTRIERTQSIGSWDQWVRLVRTLATSAREHGVSFEDRPIFGFFALIYGRSQKRGPPPTDRADFRVGLPSKPWLTNLVHETMNSLQTSRKLGDAMLRVLEHLAIERTFFETTFAGKKYLNHMKLQLYLAQHHGMTLVTDTSDLLVKLLASTGGQLGEVDLVLRRLSVLYRLELGFDTYLQIRDDWKKHSLRFVYGQAPQLFRVAPTWRERREFDRERDRLFGLWDIVLRRYDKCVAAAEASLKAAPGTYVLVINGAFRPLFEDMLERNRISYSTIQPRF